MNKKKLFSTIIVSGLAFVINYFIIFFLTSFVTVNIGTAAYGFVSLSKTFASYALIASTALNSYSSRYITIEYHKSNYKKANEYFNSVFFANVFLGMILFLIATIFTSILEKFLNVPKEISYDVKILFVLVFLNLFISLTGTVFQVAAIIKNQLILVSIAKACSYIIEAVVLIAIFTLYAPHIYYVGVGMITATFVVMVVNYIIIKRFTPQLVIDVKFYRVHAVKKLVVNGIWNSLNALGNTLNSGLDLLVTNMLLNAVTMGQVSIVKSIVNIFSSLYQMVAQPFEPIFLKDYAKENKSDLLKHLRFSMRISGMFSNLAFAGIVSYGLCYYKLWIPNQNCELLYRLTIIAVATSVFEGPMYPLYYIYTLTIKNKIPCIITIVGGVLNVCGMFILIKYTNLDVYAVFFTTAVIMTIINGITNPIYMAHCLKIKYVTFYPELVKHVISCAVMTILLKIISNYLTPNDWISLIVAALLSCAIGAVIHLIIVFGVSDVKKISQKF